MALYLIHMERVIAEGFPAQHYLGYTRIGIEKRLMRHKSGQGARLMAVCKERKIGWRLVRTWGHGTKEMEKRFKTTIRNGRLLCPVCTAVPLCREGKKVYKPRLKFVVTW